MPIDSHLPQADPFSLVPTFNMSLMRQSYDAVSGSLFLMILNKMPRSILNSHEYIVLDDINNPWGMEHLGLFLDQGVFTSGYLQVF
jgi:hypothetical protein